MWERDRAGAAASVRRGAPRSFVDALSFRAAQQADQLAYRFLATGDVHGETDELTFGELGLRSRAIGGWLQERGFAGSRALLLYPAGLEFVRSYMGCLFGGVVAVPCPAPLSGQVRRVLPRLRRLAADAGAEVVLTAAPLLAELRAAVGEVPELAALTWVATEQIPDEARSVWHDPAVGPDSIAFLQYTSGSTSAPRGVMVSHGNLVDNQRLITEAIGATPDRLAAHPGDLTVSWLPVFHDMGLLGGVLLPAYVGRTATLMSPLHFLQEPERWLDAITKYRPYLSGAPNFAYELCLRRATPQLLQRLNLTHWRVAFNAAEPVRASTLRRFAETFAPAGFRREAFYPSYGLAEATLLVAGGDVDSAPTIGPAAVEQSDADESSLVRERERELVSCGSPRMDLAIVDPELGVPCADGEVGEIWVSGPSVALGYWNDPQKTEESFNARLPDGRNAFLRTGDLGFLRDGELYVCGRLKDLLIIDGRNHYPQDLELTAETSHPAVRPGCVAAFSVRGAESGDGERPVLVAEVAAEHAADLPEIETAIRGAISREHGLAVRDVVLIEPGRIFKTSSGKIQRAATRKAYLDGSLTPASPPRHARPQDATLAATTTRALEDQPVEASQDAQSAAALHAHEDQAQAVDSSRDVRPIIGIHAHDDHVVGLDARSIESWLVNALARRVEIDPAQIRADRSIADYGVSSRGLVEIVGELSDELGYRLTPTVLYEYPTIAGAARAFVAEAASLNQPSGTDINPETHFNSDTRFDLDTRFDIGATLAPTSEPIAIVSMACRFPGGADDPEALWRILSTGIDAVGDPPGRWNPAALIDPDPDAPGKAYTLQGGYLRDIDRFDAAFFGISPREAAAMDPQQRLLLEVCWETLERAGIVPGRLAQSPTGVYVGLYDSDYLSAAGLEQLDGHVGTGSAASVASGRIAYTLGLQGPAVTIDTACSSSLVAVHLAVQALRGGECDLALAGGATVMATPRPFVEFSRLRGLSASGRCRPFADDADGMVWAEGCGLLLLKRLSDAQRDGDRVLAVIRGSAVNQDGRSQGLSAPNGLAQAKVVRAALAVADLLPRDIDYVEAHGTGTPLGDPIEARALARVFGGSRPADSPLYLGSLKSNLGHTQAAAGVGGVIKTVLALQHEELPASLYADTPTSQVDWDGIGLRVLSRSQPWPRGTRMRRAGVSSFGISGTNAHLVLEEAPERDGTARRASRAPRDSAGVAGAAASSASGTPMLFPVSARTVTALRGQADRLARALEANAHLPLQPVATTLAHHRTHFERRAVVVARERGELLAGLRALASPSSTVSSASVSQPTVLGPLDVPVNGKLAFVFPGQGSQWPGMSVDLLSRSAAFAAEFERCDAALRRHTGWSAEAVLRGEPGAPDLRRTDVVQPVLFAVAVSLAALWRSFGVQPDAVVGHSQGEIAAACVAGVLSLDDAAKAVALRGAAVSGLVGPGAMAVVEQAAERLEPRLAAFGGLVSVAAVNSGRSTVLAGDPEAIDALLADLEREQVFVRRLQADYASHSAQVEPLRETLVAELAGIASRDASVPWYSTVIGGQSRHADAEYWYRNLREPVRYAETVQRMIDDGFRYFVELSPHPSLIVATQTIAEDAQRAVAVVGSLRREEDARACLARSLGELHVAGLDVQWDLLAPNARQADLPTYAFDDERHWIEPTSASGAGGSADVDLGPAAGRHPLLGVELESAGASRWTFRKAWTAHTADWLRDHAVFGRVVLSGTTVLELCRAALDAAYPDRPADLADLLLVAPLVLPEAATIEVQVEVVAAGPAHGAAAPGAAAVESDLEAEIIVEISVYSRLRGAGASAWTLHATATGVTPRVLAAVPPPEPSQNAVSLWDGSSYARLAESGLEYGPAFQGVHSAVAIDETTVLARLSLPQSAGEYGVADRIHPALLDAALHVASTLGTPDRTLLPVAVGWSTLPTTGAAAELTATVTRTGESGTDITVDVTLWDADGFPAGALTGVRLRAVTSADLARGAGAGRDLYEIAWTPVKPSTPPTAERDGTWALIIEGADPLVHATVQALKVVGVRAVAVDADDALDALPEDTDTIVRFWPSAQAEDAADVDTAHRAHGLAATGLSDLQALLADNRPARRLVWVTRGAVATGDGDAVTGLDQSALWGLARGARTEHPDLGPSLIDLDPAAPGTVGTAAALIAAVGEAGEPELAVRNNVLLAPRLTRAPVEPPGQAPTTQASARQVPPAQVSVTQAPMTQVATTHTSVTQVPVVQVAAMPVPVTEVPVAQVATAPVPVAQVPVAQVATTPVPVTEAPVTEVPVAQAPTASDEVVLITGGLGAIGLHIARRLAAHGTRRLVLTSRRGAQDPRSEAAIEQLAALGAETEVVACDVADPDAVHALLSWIDDVAPLRGVVHAAGVLADAVVTEQNTDTLAQALRPKIAGAWNLHRATLRPSTLSRPLEFFVLVSSAVGVVGTAGQSNYAAANAFLDQLAHRRRALGLPATSISFGAWSGDGLAVRHADLGRMAGFGFGVLEPEHALDLFELAIRRSAPHLVAWSVDVERARASFARSGGTPALWRALMPPAPAASAGTDLIDRLARLTDAERAERVLAIVGAEVAHALGLSSAADVRPDRPLRELGMDSVGALEVRNRVAARIGARLPATLLFDYPTTGRLAEHLLATVLRRPEDAARQNSAMPLVRSAVRATIEPAADEPVAIVSMACRLPGGVADPEQLWRLLADGRDAIGPVPVERWDVEALYDSNPEMPGKSYAREGGFLQGIDAFDARFFGITAREAAAMDPQQRLLLETAWEALERAGIVPSRLAGSMTGVYVGMFGSEYASGSGLEQLDGYYGTGSSLSVASGRLAYTLGLVGPAMTVDTACSSSLLALHLGAAALRSGECDTALVGGATLMVTPQTFVEFSRLRGLSPGGRSRSFSDDADGTGLSEGVGMVVLKRLSDARRDGDEVLAVVRGTAVNQDGRSQGLSVPNGPSQEHVIRLALERSGLAPADIDYVEAHGTGTTLGDPIEANALARVFGPGRPAARPLYLGSLKSNLGHLQAAAGLAGLMKVVLALRHGQLPPTLHAATPSRHVDWDDSGLRLVQESVPWQSGERIRRAGVSAFGISGTNVHVVVEEVPQPEQRPAEGAVREPEVPTKRLFVLSATSDAALRRQSAQLAAYVGERPDESLADVAYTLARRRNHFACRAVVSAGDRSTLLSGLDDILREGELVGGGGTSPANSAVIRARASMREPLTGKVAFVFPGHSLRWTGMVLDLLAGDAGFAEALTRCDEAIARHAGWSVLAVLRGEQGAPDPERADVTQPLLFAVDCALAALWRSLGVEPDAVIGHSLGEIAAAHVAGMLTLDQAAALVVKRGLAVREVAGFGGSLAVELSPEQAAERIAAFDGRLSIAAVNSGSATTVSGDLEALAEFQAQLEFERISVRRVPVDFATHGAQMDRPRDGLVSQISDVGGARGALAFYSTVLAEPVPGDVLDAEYWGRNLREPVRFAAAVRRMLDDGYRYFVEIGPHPALVSSIRAVAAEADVPVEVVGSVIRGEDGYDNMLRHVAQLYCAGYEPDWSKQFPDGVLLGLPTYAFERDRHWTTPAQAQGMSAGASGRPFVQLHVEASDQPGRHVAETEIDLSDQRFAYLADHRIGGAVWLPAAAFVEMALEASVLLQPGEAVQLASVRFERALQLRADEPVRLQLVTQAPAEDGTRDFAIASRSAADAQAPWVQHVRGLMVASAGGDDDAGDVTEAFSVLRERCVDLVEMSDLYNALAAVGIEYREAFQGLENGWRGSGEALGRLAEAPRSAHLLHPALLDSAFQTVALLADAPADRAFVPVAAGRIRFVQPLARPVWASSRVRSVDAESAVLDVQLLDEQERVVLDVEGFELAALSAADGSLFEVRWHHRPIAESALPEARGRWLILDDESGIGAEIAERLGLLDAAECVVARCGDGFAVEAPGHYRIDPQDPDHYARLLGAFEDGPPERIVQLLSLDAPIPDSAEAAARAALLCCTATLRLVAALAERSWSPAPRLFLVTRGSQAAGGSAQVTNPQQALTWGFGSALAQEQPGLRATLIDLPTVGGIDALWAELLHGDDERQVALRDTGRYVPRLAPARPDGHVAQLRADRTYLVTGGLGGLGRIVVERLAGLGAHYVAVLGRSEPDAEAAQWISTMARRGVTVHAIRADVADRASLQLALDALLHNAPAVAGIVHAAGVLDDSTLLNLTPERIERVLAPKVLGTALLTELVPDTDFLVLFSSAAGLLGSAGQSSYAAANAFLDAWAHHLEPAGRRALSLDWGVWSEVGMVTGSAVRAASVARSGLGSFSPQEGGELFERVLGSARRQLAPIAIDRAALRERPELAAGRPLLADLVGGPSQQSAEGSRPGELVGRIRVAAAGERLELLESYLRGLLGKLTGEQMAHVSATTPLKGLGLDSLQLVTLYGVVGRELGIELSPSAATAPSDIRSLANAVLSALGDAATRDARGAEEISGADSPGISEAELWPATRDVMRLLRSEQQGTPSAAHNIGFAVRLLTPTTPEQLARMLGELAERHAALRTGIVADAENVLRLQVLQRPVGELLRWSVVDEGVDVDGRLRELMEQPFVLDAPPLWRFEMLEYSSSGRQVLLYGAHHAVSDAQSLVLVMAELGAELSGTRLGVAATNRDIEWLLGAQPPHAARVTQRADIGGRTEPAGQTQLADPADPADPAQLSEPTEPAWRAEFAGAQRLDLTLSRPRPATRTFRSATRFVDLPDGLLDRVTAQANRLAITPAAFCLGTLTVFLARLRERDRFALAVPVDTRMHVGALDAVGFFGVPVPFAAEAAAGEPVADVLRRTDVRLGRVLAKGASFFDAMSVLVQEGLYRPNAPLVEVYFNFIRPQALAVHGLEPVQAGTGYSDLDLMITVACDLNHLRLDYNVDIIDEQECVRFGRDYLALLGELADGAEAQTGTVLPITSAASVSAVPSASASSIALAATFALGDLPAMLEAALEVGGDGGGGGGGLTVAQAPYHQVLAALRDPAGVFAQSAAAVGVVLLRAVDLTRFGPVSDELLAELGDEYPAALRALYERTGRPMIVGVLPSASADERLSRWERELAARLRSGPGIAVLSADDWIGRLDDAAVAEPFDAETDALAHLPFSPSFQAAVALTVADLVRAVRRTPPKVIAVDGDDTLWGGVAGELGPDAVDLTGPRAALARRLLEWRAAGVLLVLVTNNDESTVRGVLERSDSLLRAEHFTAISAAWEPKAARLAAVARELGLGLDSFLFLDDNPVEIAAVRSALPEVLCVTCPAAGELEAFVTRLWPVVPKAATREDAGRADFYRQESLRSREREQTGFAEFLDRLELEVVVEPLSEATIGRSAQLSRRTNQFNLRPAPLDEAALSRWQQDGEVWTATVRDRFGDYGQVGVLVLCTDGDALEVRSWMLSCRALGRGVEERLLGWLADRAEALGRPAVRLIAENTPRNVPARRLVAALGGGDVDGPRLETAVPPARLREFRSWAEATATAGFEGEASGDAREQPGVHGV